MIKLILIGKFVSFEAGAGAAATKMERLGAGAVKVTVSLTFTPLHCFPPTIQR